MHTNPTVCPRCGYERQSHDLIVPGWQCPKCRAAYPKDILPPPPPPEGVLGFLSIHYTNLQRGLWAGIFVAGLVLMFAYLNKGATISPAAIRQELHQEPKQTPTSRPSFSIKYRKAEYVVQPVAEYELWGLVVSHNNINAFTDIYHDTNSLDTKDLCVIWGKNVQTNDFHRVSFKSGAWTCYFRYGAGVAFDKQRLSNNHLITDSDEIRRMIEKVRVGDQVHFKGLLVNYRDTRFKHRWRRTSQTRMDTGNNACEVVFVEALNILSRGTPLWYFLYSLAWWLLILLLVAKVALFAAESYFPSERQS